MELFVQSLLTGVLLGGLYAIIGVGLSLIFGIMGLTNIAHGDIMILSSFVTMIFAVEYGLNIIVALILSMIVMTVIAILFQKFLVNSVITKGEEPALLVTFGVSIIIKNVLSLVFGANSRVLPSPWGMGNAVSNEYITITNSYLINFIIAVVVIFILGFIIKRTYLGRSIRAASSSTKVAELMGVDTMKTYVITMVIAVITSCIAGMLVGQTFVFYPTSGTSYLIIAFGVVVIGGMGSIYGTLLGGMILGLSQLLGGYFIGNGYQTLIGYIVLLVLLTFRPRGLLGNMVRK